VRPDVPTESSDLERRLIESVGFAVIACLCVAAGLAVAAAVTGAAADVSESAVAEGINPNEAPAASLVRLPGVGPTRAQMIVAYRQGRADSDAETAVFRRPEDLTAIKGIGPVTVEEIRPWLQFDTSTGNPPRPPERP